MRTDSLSLIAHAGHMFADVSSLGLALFAIRLAKRPASPERTYGYNRAEILAAASNARLMWVVAAVILWEAIGRFGGGHEHGGQDHNIEGGTVVAMGLLGILVRLILAYLLSRPSKHSLNVEGALRQMVAEIVASVGLVVSGTLVILFGETEWVEIVDPILSVLLALFILVNSWGLVKSVYTVLIEGTPPDLDLYKLCHDIEEVPGVTVIHDVHVWTVTSGYVSFTAHVLVDPEHDGDYDHMLREMRRIASEQHGITHSTIQLETSVTDCTEDHHVDHLEMRERSRQRRKSIFGSSR